MLQSRGRDRGKSTSAPKFQPASLVVVPPEGGALEAEIRAGRPHLLPQFTLEGNRLQGSGSQAIEMQAFSKILQVVLGKNEMLLVEKHSAGARPAEYIAERYVWDGQNYQKAEQLISHSAPKGCIWKDQRNDANSLKQPPRIFQRSGGQIMARSGADMLFGELLSILRRNISAIRASADNAGPGGPINHAPVGVEMMADFGKRARVLAKIGVNLCAFAFGETFVRHSSFDNIKASILSGTPPIHEKTHAPQSLPENDDVAKFFLAAPQRHHLCMLDSVFVPGMGFTIVFSIRLYGGAISSFVITRSAPSITMVAPLFMLVDYMEHKINLLSKARFISIYLKS